MWQYNQTPSTELYHHGILGQKWGKQNGPPYPLDGSDHSSSERKAGWRKSLSKSKTNSGVESSDSNNATKKSFHLTDKQKKAIKIGVVAAGTALVAIGGYKLVKSGTLSRLIYAGQVVIDSRYQGERKPIKSIKTIIGNHTINDDMIKVNQRNRGKIGSKSNCVSCSIAYEMRRRGNNVGSVLDKNGKGASLLDLTSIFKYAIMKQMPDINKWSDIDDILIDKYTNGDRGIFLFRLKNRKGGHALNWEIIGDEVKIIDSQIGRMYETSATEIMDRLSMKDIYYMQTNNKRINSNLVKKIVEELD